jgi:hypothetical protein
MGVIDWVNLGQDRDQKGSRMNTITNLWLPRNDVKFFRSYTTGGLSRSARVHAVNPLVKLA